MSKGEKERAVLDRRGFMRSAGALAAAAGGWMAASSEAQDVQDGGEQTPMLQVAMLSGWHVHAKGYAKTLMGMKDAKVTAIWDEEPERGRAWADEIGVPFEPDLDKVLARPDVDAVACNAPTNRHADVMVAAAEAGKHIFTEKVMALTLEECDRIAEAVRAADVKFCISFPFRTRAETLYARQALDEGLLGDLTFFRVRVAHNAASADWLPPHFWDPEATGGGAMVDLGAHPMYLSRWLGGPPRRISSTFTHVTGRELEDNAVSVIEFANGCIGVAETSFVSTHSPFSLELSGTEGSLFVGGPQEKTVQIRSNKLSNPHWGPPEQLPEALPNPVRLWVDGVLKGTPIPFGLEEGTQLTELMVYAYRAAREGRHVDIPARP